MWQGIHILQTNKIKTGLQKVIDPRQGHGTPTMLGVLGTAALPAARCAGNCNKASVKSNVTTSSIYRSSPTWMTQNQESHIKNTEPEVDFLVRLFAC